MKKFTFLISLLFVLNTSFSQVTIIDSIISNGIYRNYRLYVPAAYDGSTPRPLLFNLHGYTSSASAQQLYSNFMPIADTANFLMVYPNGTLLNGQPHWNAGFGTGVNDVQLMSDLIDSLSLQYNIDKSCVYSTGMSNGGYMSYTLACELSNRIAAVASVTGSMVTTQLLSCNPGRPVPVMQIHGTADGSVPYNGIGASLHIDTVVKYWVTNNNCNPIAVTSMVPDINTADGCTAEHRLFNGGNSGSSVELYKIFNGGHTWPGAYPIGPTCQDFNASEKIWLFFRKYKLNQFVGIEEENEENGFSIYPNPANNFIQINCKDVSDIIMTDITGKQVLSSKQKYIDISALSKGMYVITVTVSNKRYSKKIIKSE